jgi:hypothetical protein
MRRATLAVSFLALLASVATPRPAPAETVKCTPVTALPAVIMVEGIHCLTADLTTTMTTGAAIFIKANNVVLDLNGFSLIGLAGTGTQARAIAASQQENVTVKNGTIRGFMIGVNFGGSQARGFVVEDIRAERNTRNGIEVGGFGSVVRRNHVVSTGGSTFGNVNVTVHGIFVTGVGPRVIDNDVIDTVKQGTGQSRGIILSTVTDGFAVNNRVSGADVGILISPNSTGKYRDNLTLGVATPYVGGTSVGNNN